MSDYPVPVNEEARLQALASYNVFNTAKEKDFDALTALASAICDVPISLITFIDGERQVFKSHHGTDISETPRSIAFCAHTLIADNIMIVPDARLDARFNENPLVTGPTQVAFYAGVPLINDEGYALGTLCVIDHKARKLSAMQIQALETLAGQLMDKLELRRKTSLLEQREQRFRNMVKTAKVGMTILRGEEFVVEIANLPMLAIWGRTETEVIGKRLLDIFPELHDQPFPKMLADIFTTGKPIAVAEISADIKDPSGESRSIFVDFSYEPLFAATGQVEAVMATVTDITHIVETRELLKQSQKEQLAMNEELMAANEELKAAADELAFTNQQLAMAKAVSELERGRLNQFLMQAPVGVCVLEGPELVYNFINPRYQALLPDRDLQDRSVFVALPELVGTQVEQLLLNVYHKGETFNIQELLIPVAEITGGPLFDRYFSFDYLPWRSIDGAIAGILAFVTDVTPQVAARKAISEVNQRLSIALEAGDFGTTEVDLATGIMTSTHQFKQCYGRGPNEEFNYPDLFNAMLPQYREHIKNLVTTAKENHTVYRAEYEVAWPDGTIHWISAHGLARYDENGVANRMVGVVKDITEEVADRLKLIDAERDLRMATTAADFGTWSIDPRSRKMIASPRLKELFGYYPEDEITLAGCIAQITDDYRDLVTAEVEKAITQGGNYDVTYTVRGFHDKQIRWVRAVGNLRADDSGEISSFTGIIMDVTAQKEDERRKNDFIGMVSHELKTPLTSLQGYVQIMQMMAKREEQPLLLTKLEKSATQIKKMTKLITGFLDVGRYSSGQIQLQPEVFNMHDLIWEMVNETEFTSATHTVTFAPCKEIVTLYADRDKIGQVLTNLLSNAIKYSPSANPIKVDCIIANGQITVSVIDQGMGIPANQLDKLFNRYYRVEGDQMQNTSGFGVGLYICKEIIDRHGGKIWVESKEGEGSVFSFTLPAV